jgi:hypothetical protein
LISCAANSVNPRTRANATMWNFRLKIAPSQPEKMLSHFTSTLIRSRRRKGSDVALGLTQEGLVFQRPFQDESLRRRGRIRQPLERPMRRVRLRQETFDPAISAWHAL